MPPQTISLRQLNRATLARQGLLEPMPRASIARQVARLGSLQAQHPDWPPFALQSRRTANGFLVDGGVAGTWLPRAHRDGTPDIELRPFGRLRATDRAALEAEAHRLLPVLREGAFSRYPGTD